NGLEVIEIEMEISVFQADDLGNITAIGVFAVGSQAHHLSFVTIFLVADKLADHGVETAKRVREVNAIENVNFVSFATRHHGGDKITRTVITEARSTVPRRAVVRTRDVRDVVFEMMFLKFKRTDIDFEGIGEQ